MKDVKILYERLRALPWPALGRSVGDFALYEALLAGCADTVARGGILDISKVPYPDEQTIKQVLALRREERLADEEKSFLEYFDLLEEIRLGLRGM